MKKLFAVAVAVAFALTATALIAQEKKVDPTKAPVKVEEKVKVETKTAAGKTEEKVKATEIVKFDENKAKADCEKETGLKSGAKFDNCFSKKKSEALAVKGKTELKIEEKKVEEKK